MSVTLDGGLMQRFITDSVRDLLRSQLGALGWFDAGRRHRPLRILAEQLPWDVPVEPTLVAVALQSTMVAEVEVGNELLLASEDHFVATVLAEAEGFGLHLAGDVRDIIAANFDDGRRAVVPIFDYRQPTPPQIAYAVVEDVRIEAPASHGRRDWLSHWYEIRFTTTTIWPVWLTVHHYPAPDNFPGPDNYPWSQPK